MANRVDSDLRVLTLQDQLRDMAKVLSAAAEEIDFLEDQVLSLESEVIAFAEESAGESL